MRKLLLILPVIILAACSTTYYDYSGSSVLVGQGGASMNVNGVDLWIKGTPPRKYLIIGYIEDVRPGGPIPMAARNSQLAAKAKARGGDGLLLNSDNAQVVGTFSTASVNAIGWGGPGYFWSPRIWHWGHCADDPTDRHLLRHQICQLNAS